MRKSEFEKQEGSIISDDVADENTDAANSENRTNVLEEEPLHENALYDTEFLSKYRLFRDSGLSIRESLFNAAYLVCQNKYDESEIDIKSKYRNVHEHPVTWASDKEKMHKHNRWSVGMKLLSGVVGIFNVVGKVFRGIGRFFKGIGRIPKGMDNSLRAIKAFSKAVTKSVLPITAICFGLYAGNAIYNDVISDYSFGIYVDGIYKGNTDNVDSVLEAKHQYERNLSERYGTPLVLDCEVTFKTQPFDKKSEYKPGDTSIYDEYVKSYTVRGYGLYIDNVLAAVSDSEIVLDRTVDEYISNKRAVYIDAFSVRADQIDEFVLSNHIFVMAADYPKSYFLTEAELRELFDLPALSDENVDAQADDGLQYVKREYLTGSDAGSGKFSYSLNLDYTKLDRIDDAEGMSMDNSVPSTAVTVDIAMVREEVQKEYIAFAEEIIEDDTMLEGMRRLERKGRDGEKLVYYKSTYQGKKLVKSEIIGEEYIKAPINKVVRVGTREATEEEKSLIPTGTYIYPYNGTLTSDYGWRQLRGQNNFHQGLDIYGPRGEAVVAADGGEVIEVGYSSGYGKYCKIRHNEEIVTRYAHCDSIEVEEGDLVGQGFMIGTLGASGNVTGVHVHFEIIKNGKTVDPLPYMGGVELPTGW